MFPQFLLIFHANFTQEAPMIFSNEKIYETKKNQENQIIQK